MRAKTSIRLQLGRRPLAWGVVGAAAMLAFYVLVVAAASGSWAHLRDQIGADWYLLALVVTGFGTQIALLAELRRRHRMHAAAATAGGAGATASAAGMIACCAHHIADLLPFLGLSGAATFLYDYKLTFVLVGVGINALAIAVIGRRLRNTPMPRVVTTSIHTAQAVAEMTIDQEVIAMRPHNGKPWWIGLFGSYVTALTIMIGLALGGAFPDADASASSVHGGSAHTAQSGPDRAMLARHQSMQEQMRVDTSAQMLNRMNADPMWDQMRNAEYTTMLEGQQDEIDRMLGKGAP